MLLETTQNNYSKIITAETQHEQLKFEKKGLASTFKDLWHA